MNSIINKLKKFLAVKDTVDLIKGNTTTLFLIIITIIGMIIGTISVNFISLFTIKRLDILFLSDFDSKIGQSGINTFISSFSSLFSLLLLLIIVSLSFLGPLLIPLLLGFRSFGLGLTAGYLYLIYGFKGVAFYMLVLLPGMFISSIGFISFCEKSIKFSLKVAKKFLPNPDTERIWENMILYFKQCGYALIIFMFSSLIDVCCMNVFSKLFTF